MSQHDSQIKPSLGSRPVRLSRAGLTALFLLCASSAITWAADPSPADIEFFEKKVRPLLSQHCFECHSAKKSEANLRLDHPQGWLKGGDTGPAIVPGNPDESLLVQAIRQNGADVEMPPDSRLPEAAIRVLEDWVARGAPAPVERALANGGGSDPLFVAKDFWVYQQPTDPAPPSVRDTDWSAHPVDRFILAGLEAAGLAPNLEAARGVLMRRLYFDLWGLPPESEEISAFEQDQSPDAYEKVVDRLLASPHFGERWGRHWLDLVRYAESLTLRGFIFPEAWRYRDYVIEAFNRDLAYDQFVRQQIAGDLMSSDLPAERQRQLVATTFLTLGNTNLEEQDKRQLEMDVVDEQLDVIGKAILGQSVGCARCHDHKFDPIPTRDYYALAGILRNTQLLEHANVSKWIELPLPLPPDEEAVVARHEAALSELDQETNAARKRVDQLVRQLSGAKGSGEALAAQDLPGIVVDDRDAKKVGAWTESKSVKPYVGEGYIHDADSEKGNKSLTFAPDLPQSGRYEVRLAYTASGNRAANVPVTVFSADGEKTIHVDMQSPPPLDGCFVSLGAYRFEVGGQCFVLVTNDETKGHVVADAVQFLPREDGTPAAQTAASQPAAETASKVSTNGAPPTAEDLEAARKTLAKLERQARALRSEGPQRPMVMSVREREEIADSPIHRRGSVLTLGEVVPRGFLQVVAPHSQSPLPSNHSGRLELAAWLTSAENPLTARVYANRVWHWLFGKGLVRTVDNFGTTGEPPSHPELLNHLAVRFVEENWSTKHLVKYIVLSRTYRQASTEREDALAIDRENRLLWRSNRLRLDAECLRDAMLVVSGQLSTDIGGPTIKSGTVNDYGYAHSGTRRSVYLPVLRNSLPGLFEAFDFPDPSMVVGERNTSTVAPQALYFLNDPFVREQALTAADRLRSDMALGAEAGIHLAFRRTLGREPSQAELEVARQVVGAGNPDAVDHAAWADLFQMLFSSLDFRYRD